MMRRMLTCESGAGAVELALALPMLVVMMLGIADLSLAVNEKMRLTAAARSGAQWAYGHSGETGGVAAAVTQASGLDATAITTATTSFCGCSGGANVACDATCDDGNGRREYVTITVSESWSPTLNLPGLGSIELSGTATLRVK